MLSLCNAVKCISDDVQISKGNFATSEYGIMHGSLNAQSYVGMQNKPNRLGCYIYSHKNRTILQTCDAILSKKL